MKVAGVVAGKKNGDGHTHAYMHVCTHIRTGEGNYSSIALPTPDDSYMYLNDVLFGVFNPFFILIVFFSVPFGVEIPFLHLV